METIDTEWLVVVVLFEREVVNDKVTGLIPTHIIIVFLRLKINHVQDNL